MSRRGAALAACLIAMLAALCPAQGAAEARFSFATTPGRLPKDVVPTHYRLRIEPGTETFDGEVAIDIEVARTVPAIVLNAAELAFKSAKLAAGGDEMVLAPTFDPRQETVELKSPRGPVAAGRYRLSIAYSGKIARFFQGLYRFGYKQDEGGRPVAKTMLATHMEPVSARRLFPGWDEPVYRASFEISAVVEQSLTAVSNMPQAGTKTLPGGKKEVSFERSVPMPTYLVALFIGEMDVLEDSVDDIQLRIYTAKGKRERARYAMDATRQLVHFYNEYFGERYPLSKLDQIALPGGGSGAMENWGAIAYSEARILYDPRRDSVRQQQAAYAIIAHELAHQWFGNLVTMAWWDNLWLNEGFATWMAQKVTDRFNPAWGMRLRDALSKEWALGEDARKTTHPVQTPVESDIGAMDVFDSISYAKGAAVLRMVEAYLGEEAFRSGIQRYVRAHRFSSTTTADLWHHLSEASGRDVGGLVAGWTEQPGYPVVQVSEKCEGGNSVVTVAQERFTLNDPGARLLAWNVPVTLADAAGRQTVLLDQKPRELRRPRCGAILANAGDGGYFRVEYDEALFRQLAADPRKLDPLDRLRFLLDTAALVKAGRADVTRYLGLVDKLGDETERAIWEEVIGSLRFFADLVDDEGDRAVFDRYVARVLEKPFARIGWDARAGEPLDARPLRRSFIGALGRAGYAPVVREAQARFAASAKTQIDAAIRPAVLDVVGRYADEAAYRALLGSMRTATELEHKQQALSGLRQMRDPKLVQQLMELMLTGELPPGTAVFNLTHLEGGPAQIEQGWRFVLAHLPEVLAKAPPRGRQYVLPNAASGSNDPARADELIALTAKHLEPAAQYQAEKTADWIRLKAAVKERELKRAVEWARGQTR
jgi:aminopeptidase N